MATDDGAPLAGADHSFERFYDLHRPRVHAFVARRAPAHDVDDVVAEVFTVAWRNFATIDDDGPRVVGWLLRTAHYALANVRRSTQRRTRLAARVAQ